MGQRILESRSVTETIKPVQNCCVVRDATHFSDCVFHKMFVYGIFKPLGWHFRVYIVSQEVLLSLNVSKFLVEFSLNLIPGLLQAVVNFLGLNWRDHLSWCSQLLAYRSILLVNPALIEPIRQILRHRYRIPIENSPDI